MDRRLFLLGLTALVASPAIVRASSLMPVKALVPHLYGDGDHDDTEALEALLEGRRYTRERVGYEPSVVYGGGHLFNWNQYLTTKPLHLRPGVPIAGAPRAHWYNRRVYDVTDAATRARGYYRLA